MDLLEWRIGLSGENLVKQLVTASMCEVCGRFYEEDDISILGHSGDMWVLQVFCGSCHSQFLLAAMIDGDNDPGMNSELTDLTEREILSFENVVITTDDVIDMCIFLDEYTGDVWRLFVQE